MTLGSHRLQDISSRTTPSSSRTGGTRDAFCEPRFMLIPWLRQPRRAQLPHLVRFAPRFFHEVEHRQHSSQLSSSSSTSQILQIRMRPKLCLAISSARGICSHDSPGRANLTRTRSPSPIRSRTDPAPAVEFLRVFPPWGEDEQFQRALPADGNDVLEINIFGCLSRGECLICAPTEAER